MPRVFLVAVGMKISEVAWVYVLTVFSVVYATTKLGLPRSLILDGIIVGALAELFTLPLVAGLALPGRAGLYRSRGGAGREGDT